MTTEESTEVSAPSSPPAMVVKASDILGRDLSEPAPESDVAVLEYDVGLLSAFDTTPIDPSRATLSTASELTLAAVRGLFTEVLALPAEESPEDGRLAKLPRATTKLPREKPLPKPKPPTRWEIFAKRKGIVKKKRSRLVFDEVADDWLPRHGLGSSKKRERDDEWVIEEDGDMGTSAMGKSRGKGGKRKGGRKGGDGGEEEVPVKDAFEKRDEARRKAQKKQITNQFRNERKAAKAQRSHLGVLDRDASVAGSTPDKYKERKRRLDSAIKMARGSTASMGKYDKEVRVEGVKMPKAQKRKKFQPEVAPKGASERERNSRLVDSILKKRK